MCAEPSVLESIETTMPLQVLRTTRESDSVVSLDLATIDGRPVPQWQPGAHIDVKLGNGLVRQYSLCGDYTDRSHWRIAVLRDPSSRGGSQFIHANIRPGQQIQVVGPRNHFRLVPAERYLFIAGGIGITPILPMLQQATAAGTPWTLVYGGRSRSSMAFLDSIRHYDSGNVFLIPQDECGHIDLERFLSRLRPQTAVYCCGPGPLIDAVETVCQTWPPDSLHRERFSPRQRSESAADGSFEVVLAKSGRVIQVAAGENLLSALEDAGYNVTNSCRAGICGTCLLTVLGGTPDHQDDLLSDDQRDSGTMILPCVSRSKSRQLILDL